MRPLEEDDLAAAAGVSAAAFGVAIEEPEAQARWRGRVRHLLVTDPGGCWVATLEDQVVGVAEAYLREGLWCLSLLAVDPAWQGSGAGRALFAQALAYGEGTTAGLIMASNDPRAMRLYALSDFALRPCLQTSGAIVPEELPPADPRVEPVAPDRLHELEPISRAVRGAAHTAELRYALSREAELLRLGDRGFVALLPGQGLWLLAALDEPAAEALLWTALARSGASERSIVRWIMPEQDWAIRVVTEAGLGLTAYGAVCVRGTPGPLRPFLPSAPFA